MQIVADVEPYELLKLRLLDGSHQAMSYFGYLAGYRLVHEAAQDPLFQAFLQDYMEREAMPTLAAVPGIDLAEYKRTLIERFADPKNGPQMGTRQRRRSRLGAPVLAFQISSRRCG